MKDSYDKDPFAEYDKYWDDLDKKEEKTNRRHKKEYSFDDQEPGNVQFDDRTKKVFSIIFLLFVGMVIFSIFITVVTSIFSGSIMFNFFRIPFMLFIPMFFIFFISMIFVAIYKSNKRN